MQKFHGWDLGTWLTFGLVFAPPSLWSAPVKPVLEARYAKVPLSFEANQGQTDPRVHFLSRGQGYSLFLTDSEAVLTLQTGGLVRMQLDGASQRASLSGEDRLPGTANYFIGSDPANWHSAVPTYGRVRYSNVYPGVDLLYYGSQQQLEYDFAIAPHANARQIRLHFADANQVRLQANGDLQIVGTNNSQVVFRRPVVYQEFDGARHPVTGAFKLLGENSVGFTLGRYDHNRSLVIDPTLAYSTFFAGVGGSFGTAIAVDITGNAYFSGFASSASFPLTTGGLETVSTSSNPATSNFFVAKLNPSGTALIYSAYLGGSGDVTISSIGISNVAPTTVSIAIDSAGNAYIAGETYSLDFPVTAGAFQTLNNGAADLTTNGFISKLNPTGTALVYSTYLGGSGIPGVGAQGGGNTGDGCSQIAVDASGNAYVTGAAMSTDFPVTSGAFQTVNNAAANAGANAFVTKLNATGSTLVYSTYLGGSNLDAGDAIAVDASGNAYVAGEATSTDFPVTSGAFQTSNHAAAISSSNGFITKVSSSGSTLIYSTYLGGSGYGSDAPFGDAITGIAVDSAGNAYVAGETVSNDFPITSGAFQNVNKGFSAGLLTLFASKLSASGSNLVYSTYLGSSGGDFGAGIALDTSGNAYLSGATHGADFPVTPDAFQTINKAAPAGIGGTNATLTELNQTGTNLVYSTYLGGSLTDLGGGIAVDGSGNAYVAGQAASDDFPITTGAFETSKAATYAVFISKFALGAATTGGTLTTLAANVNPQTIGASVTFTATVRSSSGGTTPIGNVVFSVDGSTVATVALNASGQAVYSTVSLSAGSHTILASYSGNSTYSASSASLSEVIVSAATVSFNTAPAGLAFSVDGVTYTSAQSLSFAAGSTHTVSVNSPQTSTGTLYTFSDWSDSGARTHTIVASAGSSYTAAFNVSYLLTIAATPSSGGSTSPASGSYYPAGTIVPITATASSGYAFSSWTGSVANTSSSKTTVIMTAPQSISASFVASGAATIFGNIASKSGPSSDRVWSIQVGNSGPAAALGVQVSGIAFAQVGGVPCSPVVTSPLPVAAANLAPNASATVPLTIDFSSCAANARFTVTIALSANAGSATGSIVRLNQFQ